MNVLSGHSNMQQQKKNITVSQRRYKCIISYFCLQFSHKWLCFSWKQSPAESCNGIFYDVLHAAFIWHEINLSLKPAYTTHTKAVNNFWYINVSIYDFHLAEIYKFHCIHSSILHPSSACSRIRSWGSRLIREAQTSLFTAASSSSSRIPRCSQASTRTQTSLTSRWLNQQT